MLFWSGSVKAVSISPPVIEIEVDRGSSVERTIEVGNETDKERVYTVGVKKFEMVGEEGNQRFVPAGEDGFDLTSWIKYKENKIIVPPKSSRKFVFTIDVPENADPGGHYASIYFSAGRPTMENDSNSKVGVEAQINSLLLVRVSGDMIEKADIESFEIKGGNILINRLPVVFVWRMRNTGNVHVRAQGNIEIRNMFGKRVELLDANPKNYRVLPGSTRRMESWWGNSSYSTDSHTGDFFQEVKREFDSFAVGKYNAKMDIVYGKGNGNFLSREISFWIIPWRAILLLAIGIIIFVFMLILLVKRYNKWIIKKHIGSS